MLAKPRPARYALAHFWDDFCHGGWFVGGIVGSIIISCGEDHPLILGMILGAIIAALAFRYTWSEY
jgi:hypothetical protein